MIPAVLKESITYAEEEAKGVSPYLVLDIETANLALDGIKFGDPRGWNISVICLTTSPGFKFFGQDEFIFIHTDFWGILPKEITNDTRTASTQEFDIFMDLVYELKIPIITHNGDNFDWPIIENSPHRGGTGYFMDDFRKANLLFDTAASLGNLTGGLRFHLQDLLHATLGSDISKTMDAANAPIAWEQGKFTEVIDYCLADCRLTGKMFSAASEDGSIVCAPSKSSKKQEIDTDSWNLWLNSQNVLNR
jgi:hypothetical protein